MVDIKIKKLSYQKPIDLKQSQLVLQIEGDSVNSVLVNTLRRLAYTCVPTYSFCRETVSIESNTSVFNNDYMKLRLSQMSYPNVKHNIHYLPEKYWKSVINYTDPKREKHTDDKLQIEMYVNVSNSGSTVMNVTTNDAEFFEDGEKKDKFNKKYPHLIVQLRPTETFKMKAVAVLGVGLSSDIWSATSNCYFDELTEKSFKLTVESAGQQTEVDILKTCCLYIKHKLENLKYILSDKYKSQKEPFILIELDNENHTVGELLNRYLQENKDVVFSGVSKPDLLIQRMVIKLQTSASVNPVQAVMKTIDNIVNIFNGVEKQIVAL